MVRMSGYRPLIMPLGGNTGIRFENSIRAVCQTWGNEENSTHQSIQRGSGVPTAVRMLCVTHRLADPGSGVCQDISGSGQ